MSRCLGEMRQQRVITSVHYTHEEAQKQCDGNLDVEARRSVYVFCLQSGGTHPWPLRASLAPSHMTHSVCPTFSLWFIGWQVLAAGLETDGDGGWKREL